MTTILLFFDISVTTSRMNLINLFSKISQGGGAHNEPVKNFQFSRNMPSPAGD